MGRSIAIVLLAVLCSAAAVLAADAQQRAIFHLGVVREGGPDIAAVEGLEEGLKEFGLLEGRDYVLESRDLRGDPTAVRAAAASLEKQNVDIIFSIATSVTIGVKAATVRTPIVFAVGSDPVAAGLVQTLSKPGGRLTGVHYLTTDLTGKRLEILKQLLPNLHRVAAFYDPDNPVAVAAMKSAHDAARQLQLEIVEAKVTSAQQLRNYLAAFKPGDADAFFYINDAMIRSQSQLIIDTLKAKKIPTMFSFPSIAAQGALAGYGVSFREVGRLSARYVHEILAGSRPGDLSVESVDRVELTLNAATARAIGISIPQAVRLSASEVIE